MDKDKVKEFQNWLFNEYSIPSFYVEDEDYISYTYDKKRNHQTIYGSFNNKRHLSEKEHKNVLFKIKEIFGDGYTEFVTLVIDGTVYSTNYARVCKKDCFHYSIEIDEKTMADLKNIFGGVHCNDVALHVCFSTMKTTLVHKP